MNYKPYGKLIDAEPSVLPPFGNRKMWKITSNCRYVTRDGWLVTVHNNQLSDLASIPRALRAFFGANGKETTAALFHDHVYAYRKQRVHALFGIESHALTWYECNILMNDLMILAGTGWLRRNAIMAGLWVGSYPVWLSYGK